MTPSRLAGALGIAILAAPLAASAVLLAAPGLDFRVHAPTGHFYIVSAATLASALVGVLLLVWVDSVRTTQTLFLGLGFTAIAVIFATHGLSTPGFLVDGFTTVRVSAGLSQLVGATFIAMSVLPAGLPGMRAPTRVSRWFIPIALVGLGGYFLVAMFAPSRLAFVPSSEGWITTVMVVTLSLLGYATWRYWRYWRVWRLTAFAGQLGTVVALVLLMETQVSMRYGETWQASWWLYHVLMLSAFLVLLGGWLLEARRARSLLLFPRALALRDGISRVHLARPKTLEALEFAVAMKDGYTREHMGRVADYSTALAHKLGLDDETIARIDLAGRIHDVGKIAVPDAVLLKPGRLTAAEFEQVKHHADRGAR